MTIVRRKYIQYIQNSVALDENPEPDLPYFSKINCNIIISSMYRFGLFPPHLWTQLCMSLLPQSHLTLRDLVILRV
jgi:hypothetical protein